MQKFNYVAYLEDGILSVGISSSEPFKDCETDGESFFNYFHVNEGDSLQVTYAELIVDSIISGWSIVGNDFSQIVISESIITKVANEFSKVLHEWLTDDEMKEVIKRNEDDMMCCASHDFCDANMAMDEAFTKVFNREFDMESDHDNKIWNDAWTAAKQNQFN